jgi:gamma-glutamyltranspeptidase/glutathione hydrolase
MRDISFDFNSRRSTVIARRGMVAASNPLAAQAGLAILRQGGNAADAAVATAAVLNVVAPASTGVGGDCFALFYDARTRKVTALNGSGRAPQALTIERLRREGIADGIPPYSAHAVTVPGAVMGWRDLLARHGRMSLADVLRDAIHYAADGYPVSPVFGAMWNLPPTARLLQKSRYAGDYLPDGVPPAIGQIVRLPELANTLRAIAEGGPDAFYGGPIAEAIVGTIQECGGVMTLADLAQHTSTWGDPIQTDYRGVTVLEHPPNGQDSPRCWR